VPVRAEPRAARSAAPDVTEQELRDLLDALRAAREGRAGVRLRTRRAGIYGELAQAFNELAERREHTTKELIRVSKAIGRDGRLDERARPDGQNGTWLESINAVNAMIGDLARPTVEVARVLDAVARGDLSQKIELTMEGRPIKGEFRRMGTTVNTMVDQLSSFADEVTRVAREVGTEGKLGGQAHVRGVSGVWKDLTDSVNSMADNLTGQVRNIAEVTTAVARGDLSRKITVDVRGEVLQLKETINTMVDQLRSFSVEVTRVAREVGTDGRLGGQAQVEGVSGVWRDLTENVNTLADNLTNQVRNIAAVTTSVANGDLSRKITVDARGEVLELKETINTMVDQLRSFSAEVTRVAREVGTEGMLGGQAEVRGVSGVWADLTENVNSMAANLTAQVRNIAEVTTAVARGDLSRKITVDVRGEVLELKETVNTMVDQLSSFADEVTRVAREVGTEGKLGGQARVQGVSGVWEDLTDNVNSMAANLTGQVRNIADVTTAVANGDLSRKITVDVRGEVLQLKDTINTMVDQLSAFADEVTRVAREVGTEGKLGGQARVEGVSGVWRDLTDSVNTLAATLTSQLRAIADVSTAVTKGDLTRTVAVEASGEILDLKDNINQMIANLRDTTDRNAQQDWLNGNLARFSSMLQGRRDVTEVSRLIMSELTPLVGGRHGAFFLTDTPQNGDDPDDRKLKLVASYAYRKRRDVPSQFAPGEGLVGQAALERKSILLTEAPQDYIAITSGLGEAPPVNIVVLPVLFEERVMGVIELASFERFTDTHLAFLDQLAETLGIVLNTILATMRTEELLQQSQGLTMELQAQSEELQAQRDELERANRELEEQAKSLRASEELLQQQQEELQQTNEELEEKAQLLEEQNARIEETRSALQQQAEQLTITSKYKSEFLANMSHELRTPLNSLLILAKLLGDNPDGNLSEKQVDFARTIYGAGTDLLELINDILDLSKVEAGKMEVNPADVSPASVADRAARTFAELAAQKGLAFDCVVADGAPDAIRTDELRLHQVLKNLLSNAFKFTDEGSVTLTIDAAGDGRVAFRVSDTGIGIPQDKLQLVFEAFQQADGTTSRRYGGTGLGLSISREIARLLGGEIVAESSLGEGSSFTLLLPPVMPAPELDGEGAAENGRPAAEALFADEDADLDPSLLLPGEVEDDRNAIEAGDRVVLIVEDDPDFARTELEMARERGFKGVVALRGDTGLALAREYRPDAIVLDLGLPVQDGWSVLERLKRMAATRHIPVHIVSATDERQNALRAGAVAVFEKPVSREQLEEAFRGIAEFLERDVRSLLVVEDDDVERRAIVELVGGGDDVEVTAVGSSEEALAALEAQRFDCVVLDLKLPKLSGFGLLEQIKEDDRFRALPVIVYTGRALTRTEERRLRKYADAIVVKDVRSPERLLDETALFLHRVESKLPEEKRRMLEQLHSADAVFEGRKVLLADDDVRNSFALAAVLEEHGMHVVYAENGREALEQLAANRDVDLVLMDIMMPELDGYEAMRQIRSSEEFERLPIISLTAKAMKGDREKSIAAGASDYITKPVDTDQLLSLMRVWLYR
jgi:CheY-like chemotaxis protein/HAMP domain-containing protein